MARYMAKNIVASGLLNECEIQLAYAIGKPEPVSYYINSSDVDCFKKIDKILGSINQVFDCTPKGCLLYTSPSPRDRTRSRMPSSA